ncbi:ABC transporter ATP-binding protein [Geomicrobium sp. JSM 1781026]|uniref:ABC transporter ATP-binding protein n=1 Tax=Geomicrobium sp. JSM 1781026 TaxID=3344580 RepID=UPI0035C17612
MTNKTVLELKEVNKWFRDKHAVQNISFAVQEGKITGILGPNGAGKSTLIRILMGIIRQDEGEVGYLIGKDHNLPRELIGFLPEERGLYKNEKIIDVILYLADLKNYDLNKARDRASMLLEKLGLKGYEKTKIEELSKGMAQKVQFIGSIIHEPKFLVLDEPFSGLDPVSQDTFKAEIRELAANGTAILLSSHQMNIVEQLCDEILLIHHGQKVAYNTVANIKEQFANYKCVLVGINEDVNFEEDDRVERMEREGQTVTIHFHQDVHPLRFVRDLPDSLEWDEMHIDRKSLHDIFVSIAKEEG